MQILIKMNHNINLFKNFKRNVLKISLLSIIATAFSSCIPQRNIVLIQDKSGSNSYPALETITEKYKLQPNDYLFINVTSPDPKLSTFFNPIQITTGNAYNQQREYFYYQIDDSMNINFPITGKISLRGCSVAEARTKIYTQISNYLSDFTLIVRLASNSFAIVGEVNKQGQYTMARDQITIFDALAQAGGFTSFAKRKEVKLVRRTESGETKTAILDLTRDDIINSEYYYIYPNDILYVRPMKIKMLGFGETLSLNLVTSLVTLYLLVISL